MQNKPKLKTLAVTVLFVLCAACPAFCARLVYVDHDATGANDGSIWADAYNCLQDALSDANASAKPVEIRVAQGVYRPDQGEDQHLEDYEATFALINGVTIKGSYAGFGEPDPNARDITLYESILSGEISDDEDTCHVVTGSGTDSTAVLDGFTITRGEATYACDCFHGGGMYNDDGSPTVANCIFLDNWALSYGGGMCNDSNSSPLVVNSTFIGNYATDGGAVDNEYGKPTFVNCLFAGNWVDEYNADSFSGGAMYNFHSSPTLANCTVWGNEVRQWWNCCGGIYNSGDDSRPRLTNCILWGNVDECGDLLEAQIKGGQPIINHCCIEGLTGDLDGTGNIGADPCFADPDNGDYHLLSERGRYWPEHDVWALDKVTSPCIDAGDPYDDPSAEPMPNGDLVNMGAYGGTPYASMSEWALRGDINRDGIVNVIDFSILADYWLQPSLRARELDNRLACASNLSAFARALLIYANDYDDEFPTAEQWCDLLLQYEHGHVTEEMFVCPSAEGGPGHYAINPNAKGWSHPDIVLLFETTAGWNQYGGPELLAPENHQGQGCNILFVDGHVEFVAAERFDELRWE